MLKAEIIKFEAQDVITASGSIVLSPCDAAGGHTLQFVNNGNGFDFVCADCGYSNSISNGTITQNP